MLRNLFDRLAGSSAKARARADELIVSGRSHEDAGRLQEACDNYRQAVQVAPDLANAHLNLGIALAAMGDRDAAARAYEAVLRLDPGHAFGNYNYANLLFIQGDRLRAETRVREALKTRPEFAEAQVLLSNILDEAGDTAGALAALEAAIRLKPTYPGAHFNHALLLKKLGRLEEAKAAAALVVKLDPTNVEAYVLLDAILRHEGFVVEALETTRHALALAPDRWDLLSRELFSLNCDELVDAESVYRRHRAFGELIEQSVPARFEHSKAARRDQHRRLRIGYVSGDLYVHPVALFLIPVLERRDRAGFEVVCYSCGTHSDHITERIRGLSDKWVDGTGLTDAQLAETIHADGIDILFDLSGHTGVSKLAVFAQKPAPVQVTWLGYLNTTGLTRMDFRLCDVRTDPPETSSRHSERLFPLPWSQWGYQPFVHVENAAAAPFERNGYVTFGSFNQPGKISTSMCRRWAQVLGRVPGSRLLVAGVSSEAKRASIARVMEQEGIGADRFHFEPRMDLARYYELYNRVDLALDTYPYGGGTTTFDSLWMGVPVVTATGDLQVSRSGASILGPLGLHEWIAASVDRYVDVAAGRAQELDELARLRRSLRARLSESAFMDVKLFTRDFEAALRRMWTLESPRAPAST
jgi:predicted O-linked N-acetylglucosamine transferase (SPINDLY family)